MRLVKPPDCLSVLFSIGHFPFATNIHPHYFLPSPLGQRRAFWRPSFPPADSLSTRVGKQLWSQSSNMTIMPAAWMLSWLGVYTLGLIKPASTCLHPESFLSSDTALFQGLIYGDRLSLYSSGCCRACSGGQAGLVHRKTHLPTSASEVLERKVYTTVAGIFKKLIHPTNSLFCWITF